MIRSIPWDAGLRDLVARPVARSRVQGLSGLTAPVRSPWFWLGLWAVAAAASFAALIPVLFDRGPALPGYEVIHRLSGVSFAACGLIAWRRRPDSAVGWLLSLAGFGVLVGPILEQIGSPVASTLALLIGELWIVAYATLILSFMTGGRLVTTVDHAIVATFFLALFVLQFAVLLFLDEPDNLLLVRPDAGIADTLVKVQFSVLAVAALVVAVVVGERWRSASAPRRRALLPSIAGSLSGLIYSAWLTTLVAGSPVVPLVWILNTAL